MVPPLDSQERKISPKRKFWGRTSRGHPGVIRTDIPAQNFGQGGQNPGKTSISAWTSITRRRGRPRPEGISKTSVRKTLGWFFVFQIPSWFELSTAGVVRNPQSGAGACGSWRHRKEVQRPLHETMRLAEARLERHAPGGSMPSEAPKHCKIQTRRDAPKMAILEAPCAPKAPGRSTTRPPEALLPPNPTWESPHFSGLNRKGQLRCLTLRIFWGSFLKITSRGKK